MRFILVFTAFLLFGFGIYSNRVTKFSGNLETYTKELEDFMSNVSDIHEDVVKQFIVSWEDDSLFTEKEQKDIVELSQKLESKNARPYPHFVNFLKFYLVIKEKGISNENYKSWVKGLNYYLESKKRNTSLLNKLLEFSYNFINEQALNKSASTFWRAISLQYKINSKKGLSIEFENAELVCYTRTDSINIYNTSGVVYPELKEWKGEGGLVTWERGGYSRDEVFADLKDYTINLSKSEYSAENVLFTNKVYFQEPLSGDLNDKVKRIKKPEDATYPKFFSYTKTFEIEDIYKNVNYQGGLSMQGAKLVGTGTRENLARLDIYRNDTLVLVAKSVYYGFKADRVSSLSTSISIKLKEDSIYHPDLFFTFRVANRELSLLKTDKYSSLGPYSNSYHNVDMNFDQLVWRLNEDYMRFTAATGAAIGNAHFESVNFFNLENFLNMMMMDQAHPLTVVRSFSQQFGSEEFPLTSLANYLRMPLTSVKHLIMRLAYGGFVFYDSNTEMIKVKPRLHDYLAASVNKIDYDVMAFSSTVESPQENAFFNLRNYDLIINGIPKISVSDSQNVTIYPKGARITMKRNRNFQFDGTVTAGLLKFYGENLFFNYDSFKVNLQNVDSVNLSYQTGELDNYGLPRIAEVQNLLQNVTGEILIDNPDNKSGRIRYPEYPIFRSKETAYVYYNNTSIQEGVYGANDFYFAVDTFEMDSLDNYNAIAMAFKGKFVSGGIFPEFRKELTIQPDHSLGFRHRTPSEGMEIYEGKGMYKDEIWLSNKGLKGKGSIKYLTSTTWSDDFNFFPDSMNTNSTRFQIQRQYTGTEYPRTRSQNNYIHWEPYNDKFWTKKTDTDFTMLTDSTKLSGELLLEPTGLSGKGRMDLKNSDLISDLLSFKSEEIFADSSDFYLKSLKKEGFTVLTENVHTHIDYRNRKGWFRSNEGYTLVTFPENKYISYIDVFEWDMMKKTLAMGNGTGGKIDNTTLDDTEPEGPRFISTDPKQDSLNFISPLSYYDYQNNFINATGVKFIDVADARVYPKDGYLTVQPNYLVRRLINAMIKANISSQHHVLHGASVEITGRKDYHGLGNYDYIDENGDIQLIHFSEVKVDTGMNTIAEGEIYESANFTLSPVFKYQGKVNLFAPDSLLHFKGTTQLNSLCENFNTEWIYFEAQINPEDIYIPIQLESRNLNRNKIYSSMFMYYDSVHVYPAFLSKRKSYSDRPMIKPQGFLHYDKASRLFKIGSKEKINKFSLSEDYLSLHREDCKLYGEGEIDLGENLGQMQLVKYGNIKHDIAQNKTELDLVMGINFFIDNEMINLMGNEIDSFPKLEAVNLNRSMITKSMNKWIGEEKAVMLRDELNLFGTINELPNELKHTILLNELKLIWNDESNSYQSVGKIGIASINGIQINKKVEGFFELRIKRSGDMMDLYLQLDRRNYYYFGYTRGVMQTLSHNRGYVQPIMDMKLKQRKLKTKRGETPYNYLISTDKKKNMFYRRWQNILEGNNAEEGLFE